jgi:hypothetical protein
MGFTEPTGSPRPLVRSYRTVSPLPRTESLRMRPFGGLFSVALSLASRPVDVIDHPALRSPDFPPAPDARPASAPRAITPPTSDRNPKHRPCSPRRQPTQVKWIPRMDGLADQFSEAVGMRVVAGNGSHHSTAAVTVMITFLNAGVLLCGSA